jgi:hypothetical protein
VVPGVRAFVGPDATRARLLQKKEKKTLRNCHHEKSSVIMKLLSKSLKA